MTSVLIDSDVLIEVTRARDAGILQDWEKLGLSDTAILCSPVTVAELWQGARPSEHTALRDLFSALICAPIDQQTGQKAGEYLRLYSKSHNVELGDALIAAAAALHRARLWTCNRKHYPMKDIGFYGD